MGQESQPNKTPKTTSGAPEHAAMPSGEKQAVTTSSSKGGTPALSRAEKRAWYYDEKRVFAVIVALIPIVFLLSVLFGVLNQSQQSKTPQQAQNTQTPDFGSDQNDQEGYRQHAWNITVDEFKQSVIANRKASSPTYGDDDFQKEFPERPDDNRENFMPYFISTAMEYLAQVPNVGTNGYFADQDSTFGGFSTLYDNLEHVYYCFVDNRLAFISTSVDSDPTDALRAKYRFIKQSSFTSGDRLYGRYDIDLFKRGGTNTRIYSVHYTQGDSPLRERFLIYIPSSTLHQFEAVVSAKVQAKEQRELKEQQAVQQKTDSKVQ